MIMFTRCRTSNFGLRLDGPGPVFCGTRSTFSRKFEAPVSGIRPASVLKSSEVKVEEDRGHINGFWECYHYRGFDKDPRMISV